MNPPPPSNGHQKNAANAIAASVTATHEDSFMKLCGPTSIKPVLIECPLVDHSSERASQSSEGVPLVSYRHEFSVAVFSWDRASGMSSTLSGAGSVGRRYLKSLQCSIAVPLADVNPGDSWGAVRERSLSGKTPREIVSPPSRRERRRPVFAAGQAPGDDRVRRPKIAVRINRRPERGIA
jgi:hypothetical protein